MDTQTLFNLIGGAGLSILGWFAREIWGAVKSLKQDVTELQKELPIYYIRRDDYRADMREIKDMLGKIFDKLDGKVDK